MKRSIGKRLFIQIMAVLIVFITIALVANTVLLKPVYKTVKKNGLIEAVDLINSLEGDYENNLAEVLAAEETLSARILIYRDDEIIYMSARLLQGRWVSGMGLTGGQTHKTGVADIPLVPGVPLNDILVQFMPKISEKNSYETVDGKTEITEIEALNNSKYLLLNTTLDDGAQMYILSEMQSLTEAVRIFNLFLVGTAAISMVFIAVMTYYMSKRFVSPIRNMNEVAKKIAELDFKTKCKVETKDELEELGKSINALSGNLESTIADLKHELENAKRLEELRKRFVATVSHDLKTPISLMQGYAIGLRSDVCEQKERRDYYAQVIAEEAERLGVLVNELMDLTQMEAGYIKLHEVDFELTDFLDEIVNKFRAANPGIDMQFIRPEKELWCRADVALMERALDNYLSNAVRHAAGNKEIKVNITGRKDRFDVSVKNSGKHIPKDKIGEIWNSFYRVDEARTRAEGGHGLGLSIVKNIQIAHGMPYGVKNVKDGVEFTLGVKKGSVPARM